MEILNEFRNEIKKITFGFTAMSEDYLIKILIFLPKLEEIEIDVSLSTTSKFSGQRLCELRNVKSFTCKAELAKLISELPPDTLAKVSFVSSLHDVPPTTETLRKIFEQQRNLVDLNFNPKNVDFESLKVLHLAKLRIASVTNVIPILKHQRKLIALSVQNELVTAEFLEVCKLLNLERLEINLRNINANIYKSLNDLAQLQDLTITLATTAQLLAFDDINLKKLESLKISSTHLKCDPNVENFEVNFPELTTLKLSRVTTSAILYLLENKKLQSLTIEQGVQSHENASFPPNNNNLIELVVNSFEGNSKFFIKFVLLPLKRLEKLQLGTNTSNDLESLNSVLANHKRLESLIIKNQKHSIEIDNFFIKTLREYGKSLRHFELGDIKNADKILEKLQGSFEAQFELIYVESKKIFLKNL